MHDPAGSNPNALADAARDGIADLDPDVIIVAGGIFAVSDAVAVEAAEACDPDCTIDRRFGAGRDQTAADLAMGLMDGTDSSRRDWSAAPVATFDVAQGTHTIYLNAQKSRVFDTNQINLGPTVLTLTFVPANCSSEPRAGPSDNMGTRRTDGRSQRRQRVGA